VARLLAGLVLILAVVSSSPVLHELLHCYALDANHECVIGAFTKGLVVPTALTALLFAVAPEFIRPALGPLPVVATRLDRRLDDTRAPPSFQFLCI
jgi:hypothetical protein